jgi:transaldolase
MRVFVDTADTAEIKLPASGLLLDGVTTNPSLVAKSGKKFTDIIREICAVVAVPVSAADAAPDYEAMMRETLPLHEVARHVAVPLPLRSIGSRARAGRTDQGLAAAFQGEWSAAGQTIA